MLQLNFYEFIFRSIPEGLIINYGIISLSQEKEIGIKKYIIFTLFSSILVNFVRQLPISFGLHIIINLVIIMSIMSVMGLSLMKSIYNTFFVYFLLSISEFINIYILSILNINIYFNIDSFRKALLGFPSLLIMTVFIFIIKLILKRKEKIKNDRELSI